MAIRLRTRAAAAHSRDDETERARVISVPAWWGLIVALLVLVGGFIWLPAGEVPVTVRGAGAVVSSPVNVPDNPTQRAVAEALEAMNATRIVVAQRLSTIVNADRIVVAEEGRIVEQGTYAQLLAAGGAFSRLAEGQQAVRVRPA